jgi:signal transduction histidine kinase
VAVLLIVLPLLARRAYPFAAPAALWIVAAAISFADHELVTGVFAIFAGGMAAAFLLGSLQNGVQARIGLAVVVGCAFVLIDHKPDHAPGDLISVPLIFAISWVAGLALGERAERLNAAEERVRSAEREREALARVAVAEERTRIAREMHDIVAHAISVMVLQVGAVRHGLPQTLPDQREALGNVERAGRDALSEMRALLDALREVGEGVAMAPQPGLDDLRNLLEQTERAGLPVRLEVEGTPTEVPRAVELSAYRIVQEGLTNALKHGRASQAEVRLGYAPEELRIEVRDDGAGKGDGAAGGAGYGLAGVGERVKLHGGEMTAGAVDGGFVLRTRLPLGGHHA